MQWWLTARRRAADPDQGPEVDGRAAPGRPHDRQPGRQAGAMDQPALQVDQAPGEARQPHTLGAPTYHARSTADAELR